MDGLVPEENPPEEDGASDDELVGATLDGRFSIEKLIGAGGMGRVYRGSQLSVERDVAIKVLHGELSLDEELKKRFFREAKVVSNFTHPNIVRLIDFGKDEEFGLLYLVMELVQGLGLDELLEHGRLRAELAMRIAHQTCGALVEAHNAGVIHRDLKAENLLLAPVSDGTLQTKVVDFGIAYPEEASEKLTRTGRIYGTASYMAPEQARGKEVDHRADLFSLGVLMFEMLTGKLPITGTNSMEVMIKQIQEGPPPLSDVMPPGELPAPIFELVDRLLSGTPEARPEDATAVRDRLESVFAEQGWQPIRVDTDRPTVEMFDPWLEPPLDIDEDQAVQRPDDDAMGEQAGKETPKLGNDQSDVGTGPTGDSGAPAAGGAGTSPAGGAGTGGGAAQQPGAAGTGGGSSGAAAAGPQSGSGEHSGPAQPATGTGPQQASSSGDGLLTVVIVLGIILVVLIPIALYVGLVVFSPKSESGLDEVASTAGPDAAAASSEGDEEESGEPGEKSGASKDESEGAASDSDPVCGDIERDRIPENWHGTYKPQEDDSGERTLKVGGKKLHVRWDGGGATVWIAKSSRDGSEFEVSCGRFTGTGDGDRCSGTIRRHGPVLVVRFEGNETCGERMAGNWVSE